MSPPHVGVGPQGPFTPAPPHGSNAMRARAWIKEAGRMDYLKHNELLT